jgi:nitrate reductase assembly molybdenum cofactor insertion protein NarJ
MANTFISQGKMLYLNIKIKKVKMEKLSGSIENKQALPSPLLINYRMLADLFFYPENEAYKEKVKCIYEYLLNVAPEAARAMQPFTGFMKISSLYEMQELFLRSFELQAITTLDIGFVLFGEDYKRGKLLVHLNQEHKNAGNDCHSELSDHLPNILNLLGKMKDEAIRDEIATRLVMPAIEKMTKEFSIEKIEKKDVIYKKHQKVLLDYSAGHRMIYQTLLQALLLAMKKDFDYVPEDYEEMKRQAGASDERPSFLSAKNDSAAGSEKDFVQNIETEMLTEK